MPDENNLVEELQKINRKLDRLTNPFKIAGLQFAAGIFHAFGNLVGTIIIALIIYHFFSSLNLGEKINQYIQSLIPRPQFTIENPFK